MRQRHWGPAILALLVVPLVVSACGGEGDQDRSDEETVTVAVERGDIRLSVTATGNIALPHQATLRFGSTGTVERVAVEEGDRVTAGQVLSVLEDDALVLGVTKAEANLLSAQNTLEEIQSSTELAKSQEAVANTRLQLQATKDALDNARAPYTAQELRKQEEAVANTRFQLQAAKEALDIARAPHDEQDLRKQEEAVANTRFQLQAAKEALDKARAPHTEQELKKQEEAVANSRFQLQAAKEALGNARTPHTEQDLRKQEEAVANTRFQLQAAKEALDKARAPFTEQDLKKQEEAVANTRLQRQAAGEALERARSPYGAAEIASAETAVERARETLANNQTKLVGTERTQARIVAQAEETLETRKTSYRQALSLKFGLPVELVAEEHIFLDPEAIIAIYPAGLPSRGGDPTVAWQNLILARDNLDAARNQEAIALTASRRAVTLGEDALRAAQERLAEVQGGSDSLDVALKEAKLATAEANLAAAEQRLVEMRAGPDLDDLALKEARLATAETTLAAAAERLAEMQAGADPLDVALKEARLATVEANLAAAEQRLVEMRAGPDLDDVALKEAKLATVEANLAAAEQRLVEMRAGPDPDDVALKEARLATAEASLAAAAERLAEMQAGADSLDVALKEARVATAEANLAKSEKALAEVEAGGDPVLLAQRTLKVKEAEQALAEAKEKLDKSEITSPFAGVVTRVNVQEGDTFGANNPAIIVVDPTEIEVNAIVDEVDVLRVREGQEALVALQSLPELQFTGTVKQVSLLSSRAQGIVSYPIVVEFSAPRAAALLREGLSTLVSIVVREEKDVLIVPVRAVTLSGRDRIVKVVREDGSTEDRTIQLGLSDGESVQILEGLEEGEKVLVFTRAQAPRIDLRGGFGGGGRPGGGLGGGGQRPPGGGR